MSEWEQGAKGQRTAPYSQSYRPAGRYILLRRAVGGPLEGISPGEGVYLTAEDASRHHTIIVLEHEAEKVGFLSSQCQGGDHHGYL